MKQLLSFLIALFAANVVLGQASSTTSTFPTGAGNTNATFVGIKSTRTDGYKLTVQGAIKVWGTGNTLGAGNFSPTIFFENRTASTGRKYFLQSSDAGLFRIVDSTAGIVDRLVINSSGNVGIGTSSPSAVFHTVGSLRHDLGSDASGDVYYRNASGLFTRLPIGTNGQVLTVSGGLPVWAAAGGGGGSGTVTNFIFTNQNGFTGTVTTSTTTPTLVLSTSLNGLLRGNGTALVTGQANLASEVTGVLSLANGGTGQSSFISGYIKSNGTALISSATVAGAEVSGNISGSAANVTGTVAVGNGGTGFTTIATGDLLYGSATNVIGKLTAGAAGRVLTMGSTGAPEWTVPASGGVGSVFGRTGAVVAQTGDYTFAQIGSTPTTLAGYGITDAIRNGTAVQSGANFNISGNGTIGNNLTVTGTTLQLGSFTQANQVQMNFRQLFNASNNGWFVGYASPTTSDFQIFGGENAAFRLHTSQVERMTVLSNGNVGVGVTNPSYKLDISGDAHISSTSGVSTGKLIISRLGVGSITLEATNSQTARLTGTLSTQLSDYSNTYGSTFRIAGGSGIVFNNSALQQIWSVDDVAVMNVGLNGSNKGKLKLYGNTSGNVTIQPADAAGTWTMTLPTTAGTNGQVLSTDGNGVTSWVSPSGGGGGLWTDAGGGNIYNTTTSGNVGIGITSPAAKLDVLMASTSQPALRLRSVAGQTASTFELQNSAGAAIIQMRPTDGTTYGQSKLTIDGANQPNNPSLSITNIGSGVSGVVLNGAGGGSVELSEFNLTPIWRYTNKHAKFHVENYGFDSSPESFAFSHANQPSDGVLMALQGQTGQVGDMLRIKNGASTNIFRVTALGGGYFADAVSVATTTIPSGYKLAVGGNIIAEKVRVKLQSTGWPDYVFQPNYKLPTLKETEQFIKTNSHLPGVPSAAQIEKEGLDLGDGQAVLLKKIEELTLHLIEMNKRLEKLEAENKSLKQQQ